ncbi:Leucine-rich repeat-containing protein 6 [Trachymyrmex septentrionalis]|uniref:Leucine-rich repeat-containing protein 6 n=1 Tax=Trachymyrmex septentrionalis TaxID=34720 RepID=A0A195EZK2_9HYME|nr:PREDICTED: protein tilB [Trachymyrmex septentrionalis]KYN33342.1 Leucine-rich repeat-containing protein 6 [Trachymyrmex septentrionalis]
MVKITFELIRKRSEHNEGEISTLEEIALHQENIDKIQLIDRHCRYLKILLLQNNLISKIENLNMLKRLEYLNLALNNIEVIENLEGLESLKKLDLTLNFIGNLQSVKSLRYNEHLEQLILMGNPCTDYEYYRQYVVATLPQLQEFDMQEIERSERIKALQIYSRAQDDVIESYRHYEKTRIAQRIHRNAETINQMNITEEQAEHTKNEQSENMNTEQDDEPENERFWKQPSYHTPEDRVVIAERFMKKQEEKHRISDTSNHSKRVLKLFAPDGRAYNMNQAKVPFRLNDESNPDFVVLEVSVYRHLDTSYIDVDINPTYVRVTIKGKILQLTLPCEVSVDKSNVQRNTTTGNLVIAMARLTPCTTIVRKDESTIKKKSSESKTKVITVRPPVTSRRALLEIGPPTVVHNFLKITEDSAKQTQKKEKKNLEDFEDNSDVPPLE